MEARPESAASANTAAPTDQTGASADHQPVLMISCDTCIMRQTDACNDCMMSVLCDVNESEAVVLNLQELRDIRLLAQAGLVPTLRHRAVG
jgi:hypothetical protein